MSMSEFEHSSNITASLKYTVTPIVDDCEGTPLDFIYTIDPTPIIPSTSAVICSEETFIINPINGPPTTIVPAGTTYIWTIVDNLDIIGDNSEPNPQTEISQQLINTTDTVQTVVYTVTPTSGAQGNCVGDPFTVTVTVVLINC